MVRRNIIAPDGDVLGESKRSRTISSHGLRSRHGSTRRRTRPVGGSSRLPLLLRRLLSPYCLAALMLRSSLYGMPMRSSDGRGSSHSSRPTPQVFRLVVCAVSNVEHFRGGVLDLIGLMGILDCRGVGYSTPGGTPLERHCRPRRGFSPWRDLDGLSSLGILPGPVGAIGLC